jgi:hypothetical protein
VFDARGRAMAGHLEAMRAAMDAAPGYDFGGTGDCRHNRFGR